MDDIAPKPPLDLTNYPRTFTGALEIVARFLRAFAQRITKERVSEYRVKNRGDELVTACRGEHRYRMHPVAWASNLARRFNVPLAGDAEEPYVMRVWWPDAWAHWHDALACVERHHLDAIVRDYAELCVSFAMTPGEDADTLRSVVEPDAPTAPFVAPLPVFDVRPGWLAFVWDQTEPFAHGADEKEGNDTRFRTEMRFDRLTGLPFACPLYTGNAHRGQMRDALASDFCARLGVDPRDPSQVSPVLAHLLFSGGQIPKGEDTARVNLDVRSAWRRLVPMLDLLGGCVPLAGGPMRGVLYDRSALPVCRETAADVVEVVAPEVVAGLDGTARRAAVSAWSETLHWSADLFEWRQLVRMEHKDLPRLGGDSDQMLVHAEVIRAGTTWCHWAGLATTEGPTAEVTRACLAHGLDLIAAKGMLGAQPARGLGAMAFRQVRGDLGVTASPYLAHLDAHADAIRDLLRGTPTPPPKTPRGKRVKNESAAEET